MIRIQVQNINIRLKRLFTWSSRPLEMIFLLLFILFLPIMEGPKNIAWGAYVLTWLINRATTHSGGRRWDGWDTLFLIWILSGVIVAIFSPFHSREWRGVWDLSRYVIMGWTLKRSGYSRPELSRLLACLFISTVLAVAHGLILLYVRGTNNAFMELHAVGHVNHSAIYMAIAYGAALSILLALSSERKKHYGMIGFCLIGIVLMGFGIVVTSSRGALGAAVLFTLFLGLAWVRKSRRAFVFLAVLMAAAGIVMFLTKAPVLEKIKGFSLQNTTGISYRNNLANTSLAAWRKYPIFGVGIRNYPQITEERVMQWKKESGQTYNPDDYLYSGHGHSLYFNTLAERGAIGLVVLLIVLTAWGWRLIRKMPGRNDGSLTWMLWGGSLSAWTVTVSAGLFNTTLHTTHGLLSLFLLGLWLNQPPSDVVPHEQP
jgi:O-antigen ligase